MSSCSRLGDLFHARVYTVSEEHQLYGMAVAVKLLNFVEHCRYFYSQDDVRHPGLLRLTLGAKDVSGIQLLDHDGGELGSPFPDATYRTDVTTSLDVIADRDAAFVLVRELARELFHAFDLSPPPPLSRIWRR